MNREEKSCIVPVLALALSVASLLLVLGLMVGTQGIVHAAPASLSSPGEGEAISTGSSPRPAKPLSSGYPSPGTNGPPGDPPRYVALSGSDLGNDCTNPGNPCRTVQYAVNQALPGDPILVAEGVYTAGGADQVVSIAKDVVIRGGYSTANWAIPDPVAQPTILDGENTVPVVYIATGTAPTIEGFHIRNGTVVTNGGGIYIAGGEPIVRRNRIYNNTAALRGGGIYVASGEPVLANNLIYANTATAQQGGGLYIANGTPLLQHNTLHGNQASDRGGGIYISSGNSVISATIVVSNTATNGGGIYGGGGSPVLDYNNVWGNDGGNYGGTLSAGDHSTSTNPLFLNVATADFHLQASSPCIDQVPITQSLAVDHAGWGRPFGPLSDMGAYEFHTGTCFARIGAGQIYTTVQDAVDVATSEDTVKVAGFCTGSGSSVVDLDKSLTLQGGYTVTNWLVAAPAAYPTILDGEGARRVVDINNVAATIDGFHIRNGWHACTVIERGGSGVYVGQANSTLRNNWIYSNVVTGTLEQSNARGGGVYLSGNNPVLENNRVYANVATGENGLGGGIYIANGAPLIRDMWVYDNEASATTTNEGGGIYISDGSATIENSQIYRNTASDGGGIAFRGGEARLQQSAIYSNTALSSGGGIHIYEASPEVIDNQIYENQATGTGMNAGGGGIYLHRCLAPLIKDNAIYENTTQRHGGGAYIHLSTGNQPIIEQNDIHHNTAAQEGGGVRVRGSGASIRNNLVYNNVASDGGGGIGAYLGSSTVENNTIYDNGTTSDGGGIYVRGTSTLPIIRNNILVNNTNYGIYSDSSIAVEYSDIWGNTSGQCGGNASCTPANGNITVNPQFVNPIQADFHLQSSSPCINTAHPNDYAPYDYEGYARPFGPRADMGAYEYYEGTCFARVGASQVYTNVQVAVSTATSGDLVKVAGTCLGTESLEVGGDTYVQTVYISQALTLRGGYTLTNWFTPTSITILDAQGTGRVIYMTGDEPVTVEGFVVQDGNSDTGGGLYIASPISPSIQNVIFYNNTANNGGGLASVGGAPLIYNNTFAYNTANSTGGGLLLGGGTPIVSNTIVASNNGSGIHAIGGATPILAYNDVWQNSGGDYVGVSAGSTDFSADPSFVDPTSGNLHLTFDSPCIHSADPNTMLQLDLEGDPRPLGRGYDVGADENPIYPDIIFRPDLKASGLPDETTVYQHILTNTGTITDVYNLAHTLVTTGPGTWNVDYTAIFTLAAGESTVVPVAVVVPAEAISGSYALAILTATSQINPALNDRVSNTTIVNWNPGVMLAPEYDEYVNPGTVMTYVHTLTNTGNAPDTFDLVWNTSRGWVRSVTPTLVTLGPRMGTSIWISLVVDATAPAGFIETTVITATSINPESGVSATVRDTFEVAHTPGDRYVAEWGDDTDNNCMVIEFPCHTLQYAATQAVAGDTIKVAAGTYYEHDITINNDIILRGGYRDDGTWENLNPNAWFSRIDAQGLGRVLNIYGNPIIEGFVMINGATSGSGGAVYVGLGDPTLSQNVIKGNTAVRNGGAVYNALGNPTLERNRIEGNTAALSGGGFYNALGTPAVWNNVFNLNTANDRGGGLYTAQGNSPLWHNTFYSNTADYGGGIYVADGAPVISNTIIVNNNAAIAGGGLYGGGGTPSSDYNDVWDNNGGDYGGNLVRGPNSIEDDPLFVDPAGADFHLLILSPCIDKGDSTPLTEDLDGHPRVTGLAPDIGADEYLQSGVILEPDNEGFGEPDQLVIYTHTLTNISNYTDTFALSTHSSQGWTITTTPEVTVNSGLTTTILVTVHIPAGTLSGTVDTTVITATSGLNTQVNDTAVDTTTVVLTRSVVLEPDHIGAFISDPIQPLPVMYTHQLTNTGNYTDTFELTWFSSEGLPVTTIPSQAEVGPGDSITVWVTVTIPALATDTLLVDTTFVTATSLFSVTAHDAVTDTTFANRITGLEFAPDNAGSGVPNELLVYTHFLTNTGNYIDTFELSTSGWGEIAGPLEVTLDAGETTSVNVEVVIPDRILSGTVDTTIVTATSQFSPTLFDPLAFTTPVSATVVDTTTVERIVALSLVPDWPDAIGWCVMAPAVVPYRFRLTNEGNYTDTFDLSGISSHGWDVTVNPNPATVGPWSAVDIWVWIQVPAIITKTEDLLTVVATSQADPGVSDAAIYETRVNWDVEVELEPNRSGTVILESEIVYTHTVTNIGEEINTFVMDWESSEGLTVNVSPFIIHDLPPGESEEIEVRIQIPDDVISATETTIITATATQYCLAWDIAIDTTTIIRPDVTLIPNNDANTEPGTILTYTHIVSNTGGVPDSYTLTGTNSLGWVVQVVPTTVPTLSPGGAVTIEVAVYVPPGVQAGTVSTSVITATSHYTTSIFDTAIDTTTVPYLPGVLLEPDCNTSADPGATVVCTHTLRNTGNYTETFLLTTRGEFALADIEPKLIGPLGPGQFHDTPVTVTIQIPDHTASGQTENTEIIVTFDTVGGQEVKVDSTYINYVAGTRYVAPVPQGLDDNNNCLVLDYGPCATVQHAVEQALPGDTIKIATGVYTDLHTFNGNTQVVYLEESLILRGGYIVDDWDTFDPIAWPTILDATKQGRVMFITGVGITPTVEGLHLTHGQINGEGGGLYIAVGAQPTVRLNTFYSNTATSGGGVYYAGGSTPILERNALAENVADDGGGFYLFGGNPVMWNNLVYGNSVDHQGGGLYIDGSNPTMWNDTIYGNIAETAGGGLYIATGSPAISQTIVVSNTNYGIYNDSGSPILAYNNAWNNGIDDYFGVVSEGPGSFRANPRFADASNYDLHLSGPSPCIDAGQPGVAQPSNDYEGNSRPLGARHDIGAYEYGLGWAKDGPGTADPGAIITYTIVVYNDSETTQTGVVITDTLHPYLSYGGTLLYTSGNGEYVDASRTISWTGDIVANSAVYITFTAQITDWLAAGMSITNVAWVDSAKTNVVTTTINPAPGTRYVTTTGDNTDNNCRWSQKPCITVQYATDQALDGDQVKVAGGTYTDTLGSGCVVNVTKSVTLTGGFAPDAWAERDPVANPTTLDAQGSSQGVCISGPNTVNVTSFLITNGNGAGVYANNATVTLVGNQIHDNSSYGINLALSTDYLLVNNIIADNGNRGLHTTASSGQLLHNTLANNSNIGAHINGSAVFINNIVYNHTLGVNVAGGSAANLWNTLWFANSTDTAGNATSNNDIYEDPSFVSPPTGNYHILGDSGAIDAGMPSSISEDIDRDLRPLLAGPDVGADEYPLAVTKWVTDHAEPGQVITYVITLEGEETGLVISDTLHPYLSYAGTLLYTSGSGSYADGVISWTGSVASPPPVVITFTARITDWLAPGTIITNAVQVEVDGAIFGTVPVETVIDPVPGTRYVTTTGDNTDNNCRWSQKPCITVQYATDQALDGDQVKVAGGIYTDTLGSGCVVNVTKSVTLTGGFAPGAWAERDPVANPTTLDAQGSSQGVCISGPNTVNVTSFLITNGNGAGVDVDSATVTLAGNQIHDNSDTGVNLLNSIDYLLVNNIIADNGNIGLQTTASSGQLLHNTLANNTTGANIDGTAVFTNNIVYNHTLGIDVAGGSAANLWNTLWFANSTDTGGNATSNDDIYDDPALMADYHIRGDSAAVDAGAWVGVDEDIDRDTRPVGLPPDVGADQYPLRVARWVEPTTAPPCGIVTHVFQLTNLGSEPLNGIQLSEPLPADTSFAGLLEYTNGSGGYATGVVTWTGSVDNLMPTWITYTAQLDEYLLSGTTITHTATITDSASTFASPSVTVTVEALDAELSKTAPPQATIGEAVTYTIVYTVPAGHVVYQPTIVDRLPLLGSTPALTYMVDSAEPPAAAVSPDGSIITWTLVTTSTPCGDPQAVIVSFAGQVQNLPGNVRGTMLTNTVAMSYTEADGGLAHAASAEWTLTLVEPVVSIGKVMDPSADLGTLDPVTVTLVVSNTGDSPLYDAVVTDTLPEGLSFVDATPGYDLNGQTVTWTLASLAPGAPVVYTITAQVNEDVEPGTILLNHASVEGSSLPGIHTAERVYTDTAQASTSTGYADLSITKQRGPAVRSPSQLVTYTLSYANVGVVQATEVRITDTLPALLTDIISATSSAATVERSGQVITWTLDAPLDRDTGGTIWLTGTVSAAAEDGDILTNTSGITTTTEEPNTTNNVDSVTTTVRLPVLTISKVVEPEEALPGDLLTYTLTVQNTGLGEATELLISDPVPADTTYQNCTGGDACGESAGTVTWTVASLPAGEAAQVAFTVQVSEDVISGTQITNSDYSVTCTQGITAEGAPVHTYVGVTGDLILEPDRSGRGETGQPMTYQHTLTNASNIVQTITLSAVSSEGWSVRVTPLSSYLETGQAVSVTVVITVGSDAISGTIDTTTITAEGEIVGLDTATITTTAYRTGYSVYLPMVVRNRGSSTSIREPVIQEPDANTYTVYLPVVVRSR